MIRYNKLLYWIDERERIRKKKEMQEPKPWSTDPVFQHTYFCNVRREDDKVTRFIRKMYSRKVFHPLFVHNIILARFLNWPDTLDDLGYIEHWDPEYVNGTLKRCAIANGKVWGNAYVVSTCGRSMDKIDYLTEIVMPSIHRELGTGIVTGLWEPTCEGVANHLMSIEGISTFMAGQVVADLKNTPGHPLWDAPDRQTFALPGPGSKRGMDWLFDYKVPTKEWQGNLRELQRKLQCDGVFLDAQDIQNVLCEFSKYMRVSTGTGRSKRNYPGA